MSGVASQNSIPYQNDYEYAHKPRVDSEWAEEFEEGFDGFSETSEYDGELDPSAQLNQLQRRIQTSGLTAAQQAEILEELNSLAATGGVDSENFSDLERALEEKIENRDNLQSSEVLVATLKQGISQNPNLSDAEKREALKRIEDFEKAQAEDPVLRVEDELGDLVELNQKHEDRVVARGKEAERGATVGPRMVQALDQIFQAPKRDEGSDYGWVPELATCVIAGSVGAFVGTSSIAVAGYTIAALGGPVAWGIATTAITAAIVFGETNAPKSKLTNLPASFQKLDLAMHGESKLEKSSAPGDAMKAIYDMNLSEADQVAALEKAVAGLPLASQAHVLSLVVSTIQENDPKKLDFLRENHPELLGSIQKTIQDGMQSIKAGELSTTGHDDYDVAFNGVDYTVSNSDTAWYRNDWNDFTIPSGEIVQPLSEALRHLQVGESLPPTPSTEGAVA